MIITKIKNTKSGFTLIEVLVAVAIVSIISAIAMASFSQARAGARDKQRVADLAQIELAMRLYTAQYGESIDCQRGLKIDGDTTVVSIPSESDACNDGPQILAFLDSFLNAVPHDPKGPGNAEYYYYFDNDHTCAPYVDGAIVFAVRTETSTPNDEEAQCPASSANDDGGYYDEGTSNVYVRKIDFTDEI